ncbi:MAG: chorismate-binding protein [Gaiellaceae bacterium]
MLTLLVDNYDSYTYNLFQLIGEVSGIPPIVVRNDEADLDELRSLPVDNIVLSPGPGHPAVARDFGVCRDILLDPPAPVLGVCLGHQGIAQAYGGHVGRAPQVAHGKVSEIQHDGDGIFAGLPQGFEAVRYHSLVLDGELPPELRRTAWTSDDLVMGVAHRDAPIWGVQFHPESVCTEHGHGLIRNFNVLSEAAGRRAGVARPGTRVRPRRATSSDAGVPRPRPAPDRNAARPSAGRLRAVRLDEWFEPADVFEPMFGHDRDAFWLDSSRAEAGLARFSFMGDASGPLSEVVSYRIGEPVRVARGGSVTTAEGSIFDFLRDRLEELRADIPDLPFDFACGYVGWLGYELRDDCGSPCQRRSELPDAVFLLADRLIAFDHEERVVYLVALVAPGAEDEADAWFGSATEDLRFWSSHVTTSSAPLRSHLERLDVDGRRYAALGQDVEFRLSRPYDRYIRDIEQIKQWLLAGESYEVCLTNRLASTVTAHPMTLYGTLRRVNPAPYAAFLRFGDYGVMSSSPERFLKIDRHGTVEAKPIKGTAPRGRTPEEDALAAAELESDPKTRAENLMIADLLRNDLGRVCDVGSVHVPRLMAVESYTTVHQLVTTVRGQRREGVSTPDCVRAAFPGGSMTGAPKLRTI